MYIAIISDIHDNLITLKKCLSWCDKNNIDRLICCGDITNSETLKYLANRFAGPIHLVRGNMEIYDEDEVEQYKNIKYYGRTGRIKLAGQQIGLCHEPYLIDKVMKSGACAIIFYGHTHKPWIAEKNNINLVNPGTLSGTFQKATFATWNTDTGQLELKLLENL